MNKVKKQLLNLIKTHALHEGSFILSSGQESNYYIDIKSIACTPLGSYLLSQQIYMELLTSIRTIAGLELGAIPLIASTAMYSCLYGLTPVNGVMIRKQSKSHGVGQHEFMDERQIAIIEDVVTTGQSVQFVIDQLECQPHQVIAIVDRNSGANFGCRYDSIFTINDLEII